MPSVLFSPMRLTLNFLGVVSTTAAAGALEEYIASRLAERKASWRAQFLARYDRYQQDMAALRAEAPNHPDGAQYFASWKSGRWPMLERPILDCIQGIALARPLERQAAESAAKKIGLGLMTGAACAVPYVLMGMAPTATLLQRCLTGAFLGAAQRPTVQAIASLSRLARGHYAADEVFAELRQRRAPILYLRSFARDARPELAQEGTEHGRIEDILATALGPLAPLIALGSPSDDLPMSGAARLYVELEHWKDAVLRLLVISHLVVLRVDTTDGIVWELDQLMSRSPRPHVLFVLIDKYGFPFDSEHFSAFRNALLNRYGVTLPAWAWNSAAIFLSAEGRIRVYTGAISDNEQWARGRPIRLHPLLAFKALGLVLADELNEMLNGQAFDDLPAHERRRQALKGLPNLFLRRFFGQGSVRWAFVHLLGPALLLTPRFTGLQWRTLFRV